MNSQGGGSGMFNGYDMATWAMIIQYFQLMHQQGGNLIFPNNYSQHVSFNMFPQATNQLNPQMPMFQSGMFNFLQQNPMQNMQNPNSIHSSQYAHMLEQSLKNTPSTSTNPPKIADIVQKSVQFIPPTLGKTPPQQFNQNMFSAFSPVVSNVSPPRQTQPSQPVQPNQQGRKVEPIKFGKEDDSQKIGRPGKRKLDSGSCNEKMMKASNTQNNKRMRSEFGGFTLGELNDHIERMKAERKRRLIELDELCKCAAQGDAYFNQFRKENPEEDRPRTADPRDNNHIYEKYFPSYFTNDMIDFMIDPKNRGGEEWVPPTNPSASVLRETEILHNKIYENHLVFILLDGHELEDYDMEFLRNRGIEPRSIGPLRRRRVEPEPEPEENGLDNEKIDGEGGEEEGFAEIVSGSPQPPSE